MGEGVNCSTEVLGDGAGEADAAGLVFGVAVGFGEGVTFAEGDVLALGEAMSTPLFHLRSFPLRIQVYFFPW